MNSLTKLQSNIKSKTTKYLIGVDLIKHSWNRFEQHGLRDPKWLEKYYDPFNNTYKYPETYNGKIPLYDRNTDKFWWFKIVCKSTNHYAYIVERSAPFGYWNQVVKVCH